MSPAHRAVTPRSIQSSRLRTFCIFPHKVRRTAVTEAAQTLQNAHRRQLTLPLTPHCQLVHQEDRGGLMAPSNALQCWRAKAPTQIHMGAQKSVADLLALKHSQNQTQNIRVGPPARRLWMTPAQDPRTTPGRVLQAANEHRTCKSKLQTVSLLAITVTQQSMLQVLVLRLTALYAAFKLARVS